MPGAERLAKCDILDELLKKQSEEKKVIAAMCAAPAVVLLAKGLLATCEASEATAHPAFDLGEAYAKDKKKRVCYSKSDGGHVVITSQGPGTAIEFALALVKELCGEEKRKEVAGPMCVPEDVFVGVNKHTRNDIVLRKNERRNVVWFVCVYVYVCAFNSNSSSSTILTYR